MVEVLVAIVKDRWWIYTFGGCVTVYKIDKSLARRDNTQSCIHPRQSTVNLVFRIVRWIQDATVRNNHQQLDTIQGLAVHSKRSLKASRS